LTKFINKCDIVGQQKSPDFIVRVTSALDRDTLNRYSQLKIKASLHRDWSISLFCPP